MSEHESTTERQEKGDAAISSSRTELHEAESSHQETQNNEKARENFCLGLSRHEFFSILPQVVIAVATTIYVIVVGFQLRSMNETLKLTNINTEITREAADAAKRAADVAEKTLILSQRLWISVTHKIAKPLTFDETGKASIYLSEILENIGQSVAVNVLSWADIIPLDPGMGYQTAISRQNQYCDTNRHPNPQAIPGYVLFPKQQRPPASTGMAATREIVEKAKSLAPPWANGKIGFAIVGCVFYRASFEPPDAGRHQTRFMYYLGWLDDEGGVNVLVEPSGVPPNLRLVLMAVGNEAV